SCALDLAKITSGASPTSSAAYSRVRSRLPLPQRLSIAMSFQPNSRRPDRSALSSDRPSGSVSLNGHKADIRRARPVSCPSAASGHTAAKPLRNPTNSRRFIANLDEITDRKRFYRKVQAAEYPRWVIRDRVES